MSTESSPLRKALQVSHEAAEHWWFSGRILACHAGGPGSIPGQCRAAFFWPLLGKLPQRSCRRSQLLSHTRPAAAKAALKLGAPPCPGRVTSSWILHTRATSWLQGQDPRALQLSGDSWAPPSPGQSPAGSCGEGCEL